MQTKTDQSYGVIPIRKKGQTWEVFLINQFSKIGNNSYWILPKGHPEAGESPLQTAIRELKEETGLVADRILETPSFDLGYTFMFEQARIKKQVSFFVGIVTQELYQLDPIEVREAGWYSLDAAAERLDYQDTKTMFAEARQFIETLP
jgi:bis(5'-nucleosidyl)-tetraphosphatase